MILNVILFRLRGKIHTEFNNQGLFIRNVLSNQHFLLIFVGWIKRFYKLQKYMIHVLYE